MFCHVGMMVSTNWHMRADVAFCSAIHQRSIRKRFLFVVLPMAVAHALASGAWNEFGGHGTNIISWCMILYEIGVERAWIGY